MSDQLEAFIVYVTVMRLRSVMDEEFRLFGPTMAGTINMGAGSIQRCWILNGV